MKDSVAAPRVIRSAVWALALAFTLSACASSSRPAWQPAYAEPGALANLRYPVVRVTTSDGTRLLLDRPALRGDSLVGSVRGQAAAVAASDVVLLEEFDPPPDPTARNFVVAGVVGAAAAVALAAAFLAILIGELDYE